MEKTDNTVKSRNLKSLRKAGKARRFLYSDKIEWNILPSNHLTFTLVLYNRKVRNQ